MVHGHIIDDAACTLALAHQFVDALPELVRQRVGHFSKLRHPRCFQFMSHRTVVTHGGVIGSFAALSATIKDPTEMVELLGRREDCNYPNLLKRGSSGNDVTR